MLLHYSRPSYLSPFTKYLESIVHHQSVHLCWLSALTLYSTDKLIPCVVPSLSQWFFHFGEEIVIAWIHIEWVRWMFQNLPLPATQESMTAAVWFLTLSWRMMGFSTTKSRRFLLSSCYYDLFAKVKEPPRETRYNIRYELIRAVGRSIRNINKDRRIEGVRFLPNIGQKVINASRVRSRPGTMDFFRA